MKKKTFRHKNKGAQPLWETLKRDWTSSKYLSGCHLVDYGLKVDKGTLAGFFSPSKGRGNGLMVSRAWRSLLHDGKGSLKGLLIREEF